MGMSSSPTRNTPGTTTKTTRPAYGLENIPITAAIVSPMNTTADTVVITAPAIATGWRMSVTNRIACAFYFRLAM